MRSILSALALCTILSSCSGSKPPAPAAELQTAAPTAVVRLSLARDSVLSLPLASQQSYSIYIPKSASSPERSPILVCFDPHGDGRIPIDKYKKWADKFGIAIAGSNSSRNGLSQQEGQQIAVNMIADITGRLGFDKKNMTICGFSGGAKVALAEAIGDAGIDRAIYMGAVIPFVPSHPIRLMGFAGQMDMNYSDLIQFDESHEQSKPGSNLLIEYSGKHEWADAVVFEQAFYWLAISAGHTDSIYQKKYIVDLIAKSNRLTGKSESAAESYQQNRTTAFILDGLSDVSAYKDQLKKIAASQDFQKVLTNKKESINYESVQKQILMQAFQNQGADWWSKVIHGYSISSKLSDKRLLGFISLGCYSYVSQLLAQHDMAGAEKILAIYESVDPSNTDQLYFHALLYAQMDKPTLAIKYLQKAVANGFNEVEKIEMEPAFASLKNEPNYSLILASLKKLAR